MSFTKDKKRIIIEYILEKVSENVPDISKRVAQNFDINQNTVHRYINELLNDGILIREKKGVYTLAKHEYTYYLHRSDGDLDSDTYAFEVCLQEHIKSMPDNVKAIWGYSFSEMINNVMDHSMAENLLVHVSVDSISTRVAIADDGVGIFEKIKNYFMLDSVEDAICELFKGKLTTDEKNHSGEGIFFSSRLMDEFYIVSSNKIFTNNRFDSDKIYDFPFEFDYSTLIVMSLSNTSKKKAYEIFDLYADVDGGFTKTKIPLKNAFDGAPISRSQAKRVCNRLEQFEEVELDFCDIDWMGQGFAHQIFSVFAKEHPEIKIIPINMSKEVKKMYMHVTK